MREAIGHSHSHGTVGGLMSGIGVAGRPVGDGRRTVGKGSSNCSKGEGCTHGWGRENLNTEGEGRVKGWGGIEGRFCGVVTQGEKGEN